MSLILAGILVIILIIEKCNDRWQRNSRDDYNNRDPTGGDWK